MATIADIKAWLNDPASGGEVYGRNWNQWCQAFVWQVCNRFGSAPRTYGSAIAAYRASTIVSTDPSAAPAGAIHYWNIGSDGHVAVSLGNGYCAMASTRVTESWGTAVGVTTTAGYTASIGGYYLGWSYENGANSVSFSDSYGGTPSTVASSGGAYSGTDFAYGLTTDAQLALQKALTALGLYSGLVDGAFGTLSVRAMQTLLVREGLLEASYDIDGIPGPLYGGALQRLADRFGYSSKGGVFDDEPGGITSSCLVDWANSILSAITAPAPSPEPSQTGTPAVVTPTYYWPSEAAWPAHGIDVSGHQSTADGTSKVDYAAFKAAGGAFVIIKWAGANIGSLYLADGREDHLSKARAAGLKVGFYYVPNNELDVASQAGYVVDTLKNVIQPGDIVALDNEPLDGAPYFPPAQAELFLSTVAKGLNVTPFFYSNPHIIRGGEDWSSVAAKYPLWVAAYNSNDGTTAGGTIDPKKYWDEIAMWQYTSVGVIPGYSGNIDRNVAEKDIFEKYGYKVPSVVASTPSTGDSTESSGGLSSATPLPSPLEQAGTTIQDVVSDVINNIKDAPTVSAETQAQQAQVIAEKVQPVDLGSIITNPVTRKVIWSIYGLTGLLIIGLMGGLTAAQWLAPEWFIFATGVYTAVSPAFASLAIANISTTKK